jgi:predicted NAD/FAD-binding protein
MNTALYLLNALAVVALVSFQVHSHSNAQDPALINVQTEQLVAHPVAKWAVMNAQQGRSAFQASDRSAIDGIEQPVPAHSPERFTF